MKNLGKTISVAGAVLALCASLALAGCNPVYVTGVNQTVTADGQTVITVTYSDGTSSVLDVNGKDGSDGADGSDLKIEDIYAAYIEQTGESITLAQFIERLNVNYTPDTSRVVADCLQSTLKVYTEFVEKSSSSSGGSIWDIGWKPSTASYVEVYTGSSVIYEIAEDYTYLITNYHVIYDADADYSGNGNSYFARNIYCYLYGSEDTPVRVSDTKINYGDYAVRCEYVGGSLTNDLAIIRASTAELRAINQNIKTVKFAESYNVGEPAIAIGNAEGEGISVTKGVVSTDNEFITLKIDNKERQYRTLRMDTAIYGGNSGGGLFNLNGEVIGITNAGDGEDQNINYALPVQLVKPAVENIMYYCKTTNAVCAKKITLGVSVSSRNSRYVYDSVKGSGRIIEEVYLSNVSGIAADLGLQKNDVVKAISINGNRRDIVRYFDISDLLLTVREGDVLTVSYERNGSDTERTTQLYTVKASDLNDVL